MRDSRKQSDSGSEGALGRITESISFYRKGDVMEMLQDLEYGKREKGLYRAQDNNREIVKRELDRLGYKVRDVERERDGWLDGFKIDKFHLMDRRTLREFHVYGNDDNTRLFEPTSGGGKSLWLKVEGTESYYSQKKQERI